MIRLDATEVVAVAELVHVALEVPPADAVELAKHPALQEPRTGHRVAGRCRRATEEYRRGVRFVWPSTRAGRRPRPPVANDRLRYRPAFRVPPAVLRAGFLRLVLVDGHNVPLRLVRVQFGRCGVLLPPHTTHLLDQLITSTPSAG